MQQQSKYLKWLAVAASIGMLLILIGGALVTKTDSGLGCGRHWPGCNGSLIPDEITTEVLIEFSHRLVTGAVSLFIVALVAWTWKTLGSVREVKFLGFLAIFFLVAQALIGAAQVLWGQGDFILALHFGISLISFSAVLLLSLIVFEVDRKFDADKVFIAPKLKWHIIGVTLYSYIVVYTGALVRHTDSSLVCPDWPLCRNNEPLAKPDNMYEWVQMGHRFAVLLIVVWIFYITLHVLKHYKSQKVIYYGWIIASSIVILQVLAGMLVVLTKLNLFISLIHSLLITLLFGLFCYMLLLISRSKNNLK
jgi:heme a synthase